MKITRTQINTIIREALELEKMPNTNPSPLSEEILQAIKDYRGRSATCGAPRIYTRDRFNRDYHPHAGACRGYSRGLALAIDKAAGKKIARMIGGWFRSAGTKYYYPSNGSIAFPPQDIEQKSGEKWEEHWWVEVNDWYVDVSADQFFPSDLQKQKEHAVVITPANFEKYYPHRRRPLNRQIDIPENLEMLIKKIVSMKQSQRWGHDHDLAIRWLKKMGTRYGFTDQQITNLTATLRHERVHVDFKDIAQLRNLFGEVL